LSICILLNCSLVRRQGPVCKGILFASRKFDNLLLQARQEISDSHLFATTSRGGKVGGPVFKLNAHQNPRSQLILASLGILAALFVLTSPSAAQPQAPKRVLLLMQEDVSWPAFRLIEENLRATLRSTLPGSLLIFSEHLNRVHFPDPAFQSQQSAWIQKKYESTKFDLVIGVGDVPTDLFPGIPLLYLRTDPSQKPPIYSGTSKDPVNLWIAVDARKTLEVARRLQPKATQVVVIGSTSTTGKNLLAQVRDQITPDSAGLTLIYLDHLTFDEICKKVSTLGPESIVLFVILSRDGAGRSFISAEVIPKISELSGAPVYGVLDTHVGAGAVGGYVVRFAEMGKRAGELGLQMLAGQHPSDEEVRSDYLFDCRQLRRWNISESALPAGSLVFYRQPSLWESYRYYILGSIFLTVLETLLIFGLLWQRADRRRFEHSLLHRVAFENMLSDLSATFINLPVDQIGATMGKSLRRIAEFLNFDRITLYDCSQENKDARKTFSWHQQGVQEPPAVIEASLLPWWNARLLRGEALFVSDAEALPHEASMEKQYVTGLRAVSLATLPLKAGEELFGGISFVSTTRRVEWSDDLVEQLKLIAEIFSNAVARQRAQIAQLRHAAIVESSDDAIVSRSLEGIIMTWNAAAQRLFGFAQAEAIGKPIAMLVPQELQYEEEMFLERLQAGERVEHYETVRVSKEGNRIHVSLTLSAIRDSAGTIVGYSKIARDITDQKRADQVLRESEDRFRLVADTAPVLIWMSNTEKLCIFFNQRWLDFTGRSFMDEYGKGWATGVHPDDIQRCLETYENSFDARVEFEMEYRLRRFDGEYRWLVDYGVPRFESDGTFRGYIGSCLDITERKSSAESLHALTGRLIHAQEEERSRIARELHDDFSQRLALQCIELIQISNDFPDSAKRAKLLELVKRSRKMASDIRSLSHQLHSSKLDYVGLVPTVRGLCEEIQETYGIEIRFSERGISPSLSKDVALCLFRISQEALSNIVKHSDAKCAQVHLNANANSVTLQVTDEGRGFHQDVGHPDAGIGFTGMRERLRPVGGKLSITSEPMKGTTILAEVPLVASENNQARTQSASGMET
jgi:PAS domain S-box-containing protein